MPDIHKDTDRAPWWIAVLVLGAAVVVVMAALIVVGFVIWDSERSCPAQSTEPLAKPRAEEAVVPERMMPLPPPPGVGGGRRPQPPPQPE